jgi:hypothetical protein
LHSELDKEEALRLSGFEISQISRFNPKQKRAQVVIQIGFENDEAPGGLFVIETRVRVPYGPNVTIQETQDAARAGAIRLLESGLSQLKEHNLSELAELADRAKGRSSGKY